MSGIIVAGMHDSGTSVTAALLAKAGWHPGEDLVSDDPGQGKAFWEDATFVDLHRAWIRIGLPAGGSHVDWGLSHEGRIDHSNLPDARQQCSDFAARRDFERSRWVAKDPRATLFLQHWASVPGLRFVLTYRSPWDNVDSIMRLGYGPFCADPGWIRMAWMHYNSELLGFVRNHRERCLLVAVETVVQDPFSLGGIFEDTFGESPGHIEGSVVDPSRFVTRPEGSAISALYADLHPLCHDLLEELDALADLPRRHGRRATGSYGTPVAGGTLPSGTGLQIVIPCRNDGGYIDEAIASVEESMHGPTELTIVDDGSTDPETLRIMQALRTSGRHVVTTAGVGLPAARNLGCQVSRTAAVLPLDADNRVTSVLLAATGPVERGETDVVHGSWRRFGLDSAEVHPPAASWAAFLPRNTVDACAVVSRRLVEAIGGWDERLPFWEDWDFWLSAMEQGARFTRLDEITFTYLVRPGSMLAGLSSDPDLQESVGRSILEKHRAALKLVADGGSAWSVDVALDLSVQLGARDRWADAVEADRSALKDELERLAAEQAATRAELDAVRAELAQHRRPSVASRAAIRGLVPALRVRLAGITRRSG